MKTRLPCTLAILTLAVATLTVPALGREPVGLRLSTTSPPEPPDSWEYFEPSIAVDSDEPDRVLLVSSRRRYEPFRGRDYAWTSLDAGATWSPPRFAMKHAYPTAEYGNGDPVAVAGSGGSLYAVSMAWFTTGPDGDRRRRESLLLSKWSGPAATFSQLSEVVAFERSVSGGTPADPATLPPPYWLDDARPTFHAAEPQTTGYGTDKEWIAVDRSGGPRDGWIYVVWDPTGGSRGPAMLAVSEDGGRSFRVSDLARIAPRQDRVRGLQAVVRDDGALDLAWIDEQRAGLLHASSRDGGRTWSAPTRVRAIRPFVQGGRPVYIDNFSLATTPGGGLALCGIVFPEWRPDERFTPPRETVYCTTWSDGARWSDPQPIDDRLPAPTRTALPTVVATADATWATVYRMTDTMTDVVLYRSDDDGIAWREVAVLAARRVGSDSIRTVAGRAPMEPGDYVGLAGAADRLYAAYVLPSTDDPMSPPGLYVTRIETGDGS